MNSTRFEHHLLVENTSISNALATTPEWLQNGAVPSHLMQPCQQPVLSSDPPGGKISQHVGEIMYGSEENVYKI